MHYTIKPLRSIVDLWQTDAGIGRAGFVKALREVTGCGLKEAVDASKVLEAGLPVAIDASTDGRAVQALSPWCSIEPADGLTDGLTDASLALYARLREAIWERATAILDLWGARRNSLMDVSFEGATAEIMATDRDGNTFTLVVPRSWFVQMPAAGLVKNNTWAKEPGRLRYTYMGG